MVLRKLFTIDSTTNGKGPVLFSWSKDGSVLAVAGANRRVVIVDRQGKMIHQLSMSGPGAVTGLEWDCLGEVLAVMQLNSPVVVLWNVVLKKQDQIETGLKDLTFLLWSRSGPQLAIGSQKGVLLMFNRKTMKKNTVMGKHTKKISCGAWNTQNRLALGGEDRQLTVSDAEGGDIEAIGVKLEPSSMVFCDMKGDERTTVRETTVSANLMGKTLLLYNIASHVPPVELTFQARYGAIMGFKWFGDGYILIGFSNGFVIVISTHLKEIGQEVASARFHRDNLGDVTYCPAMMKGASVGDNCVRVYEMDELSKMSEQRSEKYDFDNEYGNLTRVDWTEDGQILTVSSKNGNVYAFLTRIPVLSDSCQSRLVYLVSLRELSIRDVALDTDVGHVQIEIEPSFVSLGPGTVALGMNNHVWYYRYTTPTETRGTNLSSLEDVKLVGTRVFATSVDVVKVNAKYAAVLMDGRVMLHLIDQKEDDPSQHIQTDKRLLPRNFPDKESASITCIAITHAFFFYGTQAGNINVFSLDEFEPVTEYRTTSQVPIRALFPNPSGTRVAFIDINNCGFIFSPSNDHVLSIENFHAGTERILWDVVDPTVLCGIQKAEIVTYVYSPYTRHGATCTQVVKRDEDNAATSTPCATLRPFGFNCIMMYQGTVVSQIQSGSLATTPLESHVGVSFSARHDASNDSFYNNLALEHLESALKCAMKAEHKTLIATAALNVLDVDLALRVYQELGNVAHVMALDRLRLVNEKYQLLGYIAMFFKNFSEAQTNFMRSSNPRLALEMRRNLMHWDQALTLAETLSPDDVPMISKEYAAQLEFRGEFPNALEMYRRGKVQVDEDADSQTTTRSPLSLNNEACDAGEARMLLRTGAIRIGCQAALHTGNRALCNECAGILESMKQWEEAAVLYEKGEQYEKAARIQILNIKNLKAAQKLLPKIRAKNIIVMYAKAKETEGSYADAESAYAQAEDWDNVVRLKVEFLNDIHSAHVIVRRTKSNDAAALVARSCVKLGEFKAAIEFLLMARKTNEAMDIAKKHNEMKTLGETLVEHARSLPPGSGVTFHEEYIGIATWYESNSDHEPAGDFYALALQYPRALGKYIQVGTESCLQKAIGVVAQAKNETLTHRMFEYLMGEVDGKPKDLNYIMRLYLSLHAYDKAARTAVILSKQEQELGNYRVAHRMLYETFCTLRANNVRILGELRRTLMLQHSYLIVKGLAKLSDHYGSARMLLRVARNIQKFPKHIVPILTSTVIECLKVDFKASAYQYATVLVQPQYRMLVPEKHRKKIENTVRKKGKEELEDPIERATPCPYCDTAVPETTLECHNCKNAIPFCIVTGRHMVVEEWSSCPKCEFPALFKPFVALLEDDPKCPMCEEPLQPQDIVKRDRNDVKVVPFQDDEKEVTVPTKLGQE